MPQQSLGMRAAQYPSIHTDHKLGSHPYTTDKYLAVDAMFIDHRVAHGLAKIALDTGRVTTQECDSELFAIVRNVLRATKMRGNAREARRVVVPRLLKALDGDDMWAEPDMEGGAARVNCLRVIKSADLGLWAILYVIDAVSTEITKTVLLEIAPHAIARCMQRNGTDKMSGILPELLAAVTMVNVVRRQAFKENWLQVGLPTPLGVFVGEVNAGVPVMRTYLKLWESGPPSRWKAYQKVFHPMPSEWDRIASREYAERMSHWLDTNEPLSLRCPFLLESPRELEDPIEERWRAARAAQREMEVASADEHAPTSAFRTQ